MRAVALSIAAVSPSVLASVASAQVNYQRVALMGDPVPQGSGTDPRLRSVGLPMINVAGQVAWVSGIGNDGVPTRDAAIVWDGGQFRLVAEGGGTAPGTGGALFDDISLPPHITLNDTGLFGFSARLSGAGVVPGNRYGTWIVSPAGTELLYRSGTAAPGYPGAVFEDAVNVPLRLTDDGKLLFRAPVVDPTMPSGQGYGMWYGTPGDVQLVARWRGPAPDAPAGSTIAGWSYVGVSDNGRVVFPANVLDPSGSNPRWVLYSGPTNDLKLVTTAVSAPETTASFDSFESPVINRSGMIAFNAKLAGAGVGDANDEGIWAGQPGAIQLVARIGQQAPGTAPGTLFSANDQTREDRWDPLTNPLINSRGEIAFGARFDGAADASNNWGIYAGEPEDLRLVARSGDAVPGATPGTRFMGSIPGGEYISPFTALSLNEVGQVAFLADLTGPDVSLENKHALFATTPEGQIVTVAREGDMFDMGGGEMRRIASIGFTGYDDSVFGSTSFNSSGQLVFYLGFYDGSNGIFVATVPEPVAVAPVVILAAAGLRRRRGRIMATR